MLHEGSVLLIPKTRGGNLHATLSLRKGVPNTVFNDKILQNTYIIGHSFFILLLNYILQKDMLS